MLQSPHLSPRPAARYARTLTRGTGPRSGDPILELVDREPTPLEAAALSDTVEELFRGLDEHHRETVSMLLQGYTVEEIAAALACSERTVRRARGRLKERLKQLDTA